MGLTPAERTALIEQYAAGPARLRAAFAAVPSAARTWRPKPDAWSAHEVVCHTADSETNAYVRIRFLLAEASPVLVGYDQDRWASVFDYHTRSAEVALAVVEAVRASTAALVRSLPEDAWARAGRHTESGAYGAEDWLRIYAAHLHDHAAQIEDGVRRWEAAGRP